MSGNITEVNKKILGWRCGNRCAMPDCRKELIIDGTENDPDSIIGEIAHIKGEKPNSARYYPDMDDVKRNSHQNLIILCRDHHKMIDDQPNTYNVQKLLMIKEQHENWIKDSITQQVIEITFAELDVVTKYLNSKQVVHNDSYTIIPPKDKIKKNGLSSQIEKLITIGMIQVTQVQDFINKSIDVEFGENLKQGFVLEYQRLKNEEKLNGDDLFNALLDFASGGRNEFNNKAAGLSVLVYLFENCDVFEK